MIPIAWTAIGSWALVLFGLLAAAWFLHRRAQRDRSRARHPSSPRDHGLSLLVDDAADHMRRHPAFRRRRPRPRHRGRRLPEPVVAALTDVEWPSLEERLLSGVVYDRVGEQIAAEHERNVSEMPEIDGGNR